MRELKEKTSTEAEDAKNMVESTRELQQAGQLLAFLRQLMLTLDVFYFCH